MPIFKKFLANLLLDVDDSFRVKIEWHYDFDILDGRVRNVHLMIDLQDIAVRHFRSVMTSSTNRYVKYSTLYVTETLTFKLTYKFNRSIICSWKIKQLMVLFGISSFIVSSSVQLCLTLELSTIKTSEFVLSEILKWKRNRKTVKYNKINTRITFIYFIKESFKSLKIYCFTSIIRLTKIMK